MRDRRWGNDPALTETLPEVKTARIDACLGKLVIECKGLGCSGFSNSGDHEPDPW
jgi:hypothetical protein